MNKEENKIPRGWIEVKLDDVSIISTGNTPSKRQVSYYGGGNPFYKPSDLNAGVVSNASEYLSDEGMTVARHISKDSILVTCIGATIGKTGIIKKSGAFNQQINGITPVISNPLFFYYQIIEESFQKKLIEKSSSTTIPIINKTKFSQLKFKLAPLEEQDRIVSKIEELFSELDHAEDELINSKNKLIVYKQSLLKDAFEGNLSSKSEIFKKRRLKDVVNTIQYGYTSKSESKQVGPKYLRITDIQKGKVNWELVPNCKIEDSDFRKYRLSKGDILFARSGNTVGKTFLIKNLDLDSVFASYLIRIKSNESLVAPLYLSFYFQSQKYWEQINSGVSGTGQPNFNGTKLGELLIPICSIQEQANICQKLETYFSRIHQIEDVLKTSLEKIKIFKKVILNMGFRGELTLQKSEDISSIRLLNDISKEKEDYLKKLRLVDKSKTQRTMNKSKTILDILKESKMPISAKDIWQQSIHKDDIEKFYEELKTIEDLIEETRDGIESKLVIRDENR